MHVQGSQPEATHKHTTNKRPKRISVSVTKGERKENVKFILRIVMIFPFES